MKYLLLALCLVSQMAHAQELDLATRIVTEYPEYVPEEAHDLDMLQAADAACNQIQDTEEQPALAMCEAYDKE